MEISQSSLVKILIIITLLFVILGVVGLLIVNNNSNTVSNSMNTNQSLTSISPSDFSQEIVDDDAIIIDIRTPQEFSSGRIRGAQNIDFYESDFQDELDKLDRDASYKIYCNSGNRSAQALKMMEEMGFTNVVELDGGIQAWSQSGNDVCLNC